MNVATVEIAIPFATACVKWNHIKMAEKKFLTRNFEFITKKPFDWDIRQFQLANGALEHFIIPIFRVNGDYYQVILNRTSVKLREDEKKQLLHIYSQAADFAIKYVKIKKNENIDEEDDMKRVWNKNTQEQSCTTNNKNLSKIENIEELHIFGKLLNTILDIEIGKRFKGFETFTVHCLANDIDWEDPMCSSNDLYIPANVMTQTGILELLVFVETRLKLTNPNNLGFWKYKNVLKTMNGEIPSKKVLSYTVVGKGHFEYQLSHRDYKQDGYKIMEMNYYPQHTEFPISPPTQPRVCKFLMEKRIGKHAELKRKLLLNWLDDLFYSLIEPKNHLPSEYLSTVDYMECSSVVSKFSPALTILDECLGARSALNVVFTPTTITDCIEWIPVNDYVNQMRAKLEPIVDTLRHYLFQWCDDGNYVPSPDEYKNIQLCESLLVLLTDGVIEVASKKDVSSSSCFHPQVATNLGLSLVYHLNDVKKKLQFGICDGWELASFFTKTESNILLYHKYVRNSDLRDCQIRNASKILQARNDSFIQRDDDVSSSSSISTWPSLVAAIHQKPILDSIEKYLNLWDIKKLRLTCKQISKDLASTLAARSWLKVDYKNLYTCKRLETDMNLKSADEFVESRECAINNDNILKFHKMTIRNFSSPFEEKNDLEQFRTPMAVIGNACHIKKLKILNFDVKLHSVIHELGYYMKNLEELKLVIHPNCKLERIIPDLIENPTFDKLKTLCIKQRGTRSLTELKIRWNMSYHTAFAALISKFTNLQYVKCEVDSKHIFDGLDEWLNKYYWLKYGFTLNEVIKKEGKMCNDVYLLHVVRQKPTWLQVEDNHNPDFYLENRDKLVDYRLQETSLTDLFEVEYYDGDDDDDEMYETEEENEDEEDSSARFSDVYYEWHKDNTVVNAVDKRRRDLKRKYDVAFPETAEIIMIDKYDCTNQIHK